MKKNYIKPEIGLNVFNAGDVITTSSFGEKTITLLRKSDGPLTLDDNALSADTGIVYFDMSE